MSCFLSENRFPLFRKHSRLQTQSGPPSDGGCQGDGGVEVACEFVIAGGNAAPILETTEGALDHIAMPVSGAVEGVQAFADGVVWNDRPGSPAAQELAQGIAVIGRIGSALPGGRQLRDEACSGPHIAELTWRHLDGDGPAERVADRVDLGGAAAA